MAATSSRHIRRLFVVAGRIFHVEPAVKRLEEISRQNGGQRVFYVDRAGPDIDFVIGVGHAAIQTRCLSFENTNSAEAFDKAAKKAVSTEPVLAPVNVRVQLAKPLQKPDPKEWHFTGPALTR